ncbi:hypothetical protein ASC84_12300 [Acinetobacter sp. Root1280]|nr:hypothetical protein ASC84_12300 [Acinetobacter sp. Root1280]
MKKILILSAILPSLCFADTKQLDNDIHECPCPTYKELDYLLFYEQTPRGLYEKNINFICNFT